MIRLSLMSFSLVTLGMCPSFECYAAERSPLALHLGEDGRVVGLRRRRVAGGADRVLLVEAMLVASQRLRPQVFHLPPCLADGTDDPHDPHRLLVRSCCHWRRRMSRSTLCRLTRASSCSIVNR